jgi:polysaccharide export outer membrane protein
MVGASNPKPNSIVKPATSIFLSGLLVLTGAEVSFAQTRRRVTQTTATPCPQAEPYTLGAGDRIQLDVFNVPEYTREYQVLPDGTVNLALVGRVSVAGLTLEQASNVVRTRYAPFLRRPIITVILVAPRPLNVAVSGEITRPGSYSIPITAGGAGIQFPTLTQALTLAGGITQSADLPRVQVVRPGRGTIAVNLLSLLQRGDQCQNIALRDGDSIFIPTAAGINPAAASQLATASFAPAGNQPINVVVVGEVTRPGPQIVQPDQTGALPTISRALQVAGGIRQSADISRIQVRRATRGGRQQAISVNLQRLLRAGDRSQDLVLQQGDTIVVPTATTANRFQALDLAAASFAPTTNQPINVAVVGEVTRPGPQVVQPDQSGAVPTVSRALQVAGGIRQSADISRIQVLRPTRGGGQQVFNVNLQQLLRAGDRSQDLILQQGDTVFVPTATTANATQALDLAAASFAPTTNQPINVAVVGEVTRPGPQVVQPDQSGAVPTVSRALQVAGGIRQSADISRIQVLRPTRGGGQQVFNVNLQQLLRAGDRSQDLILQQGDTVFVPTATSVNPAQALDLAAASFAPTTNQPINVAVVGEVTRPGPQVVQPDQSGAVPTVSRALQIAGGIRQSADISRIQVIRSTRSGGQQTLNVDLSQLLDNGDRAQDVILQQGDTVFVPPATSVNATQALDLAASSFAPATNQPLNVVVVGEVTRPGPYVVQPEGTGAVPTLARALQVAGGIRQTADITQIQIIRLVRGGRQQRFTVNYSQLLQTADRTQDIILQQGDTIFVPASVSPTAADSLALASSSVSATGAQPLNVAVTGEVQRPGSYVIQPAQPPTVIVSALPSVAGLPTVTQAIQIAGGITQSADIRRIEVRRVTQAGVEQRISVNFWQLLVSGDRSQDIVLQQGDTIFVPTAVNIDPAEAALLADASFSPATIPVNVVGEVTRPGITQVRPNTPLNQAILAAGGFNTRARKATVELLRLNPNGTVSRRTIEVDLDKGTNEQTNPTLRPNDVILVARSGLARTTDSLGLILNPVGQGFSFLNFFRDFMRLFGVTVP